MKSLTRITLLVLIALISVGCRESASWPGVDLCEHDDHDALGHLSERLMDMEQQGATTETEALIEQLGRKHCDTKPVASRNEAMEPPELYSRCRESVVVVASLYVCDKCSKQHTNVASGFVIAADGVIVTSYHVLDKPDNHAFAVITADDRVFPVSEVLAADREQDVAVVKIPASSLTPLPIVADVPTGTAVAVISHPLRYFFLFTQGHVAGYSTDTVGGRAIERVLITADFAIGSSGGPVLDHNGNVVAMVCSTTPIVPPSEKYAQMVIKTCVTGKAMLSLLDGQ